MDGQMFFKTLLSGKSATAPPIQFSGGDDTNCFPVRGSEVEVVSSLGDHDVGSSKLKIKNIVNFGWEHKFYPGRIVAAHRSDTYLAYTITTPGKGCGVVRVLNRDTEERTLIKGMAGPVVDLAFSHSLSEVLVGAVDSLGSLFVYRVLEQSNGLSTERVMEVVRGGGEPGQLHRLIWCPYLPDPGEEDPEDSSAARLLVLTHAGRAEVWSLDMVAEAHGSGPLSPQDVESGLLAIDEVGNGDILDAAFSPDGSALATACSDGQVKFFQVYMQEEGPPRCLHQWSPHDGKAVSSLFFLDDTTTPRPDAQFWKFAVTGCANNSELKVWSCESWSCLQTVRLGGPNQDAEPARLQAALDPAASFLVLSDIDRKLVFVLNLAQGDSRAEVVSVAEFLTPSPFLSLTVAAAGLRTVKQNTEGVEVSQEDCTGEEDTEKTVVRMFIVQPKSMQECSVIYDNADNALSDRSMERSLSPPLLDLLVGAGVAPSSSLPTPASPLGQSSPRPALPSPSGLPLPPPAMTTSVSQLAEAASKISLLSPDQFQPPAAVQVKAEPVSPAVSPVAASLASCPPPAVAVKLETVLTVSGNSSPSREVAGILEDIRQYQEEEGDDEATEEETEENLSFQPATGVITPVPAALPEPSQVKVVSFPTAPVVSNSSQQVGLEEVVVKLETALASHLAGLEERLARAAAAAARAESEAAATRVTAGLAGVVEQAVQQELQRCLPGLVRRGLDGTQQEVATRLAGVEGRLARELSSGAAREAFGRAAGESVAGLVQQSYKQEFAQQAKGFERAMTGMLRQVNDQFLAGCREYEALLGRKEEREIFNVTEQLSPVQAAVQGVVGEVRATREVVARLQQEQAALSRQTEELRNNGLTAKQVREIMREEVAGLAALQQPRQQDQQPGLSTQQQLQQLVQQGRLNEAFQTALSSSDLAIVVYTCELVNTTQVFNSATCPLSQNVLLSLIQQLSVDLNDRTQVKHAYLHEALVHLDPSDPTTRVHIKPVLSQLDNSLARYIQENPNSKMTRNMKILAMAAASHLQRQ